MYFPLGHERLSYQIIFRGVNDTSRNNVPSDSDQLNLGDDNDNVVTSTNMKESNRPHRRRTFFQNASLLLTVPTVILPPLPANAMYQDATTKIQLPSLNEIESVISTTWSPDDNPFRNDVFDSKSSFARLNTSPDANFYASPRFVEHVDSNAVSIITRYLSSTNTKDGEGGVFKKGDAVLDLCTSWTPYINPSTVKDLELRRVVGLGMNEEEMKGNNILSEFAVVDLNSKGSGGVGGKGDLLPYEKESFDVVLCQLSIDYLVRPLEVMEDVWRVLRPGGKVVILFSNRLFLEKAVGLWTGADDVDHAYTVGTYLRFCQGNFINIEAKDLSTRTKKGKEMLIVGDPVYVVTATRGNAI